MAWINTFKNLPEEQKKALVEKAYEKGYSYEHKYGNCAQCTLAALDDLFDCVDDSVFKSAYNLGAGFGMSCRGTCGALNAAAMIIGSFYGRDRDHFESGIRYYDCLALSRKILYRYIDIYGACICQDVQKKIFGGRSFDLSVPEQFQAFEAAGGHADKCTSVVGTVCKLFAQMVVDGEV